MLKVLMLVKVQYSVLNFQNDFFFNFITLYKKLLVTLQPKCVV